MFDALIAVIWVVFMIVAAINAIIKKKKQQEGQVSPIAASKSEYTAREEDIRSFLEEIGGRSKPATPPQPAPAQTPPPQRKKQSERSLWDERKDALVKARARRKKARSSSPAPVKTPKSTPSQSVWDEADASQIPVLSEEYDPLAALTPRISPIQRAIIWREVLDTPPGLRAGMSAERG